MPRDDSESPLSSLATVLESLFLRHPDPVALVDSHGRILGANAAAHVMGAVIGAPVATMLGAMFSDDHRVELKQSCQAALDGESRRVRVDEIDDDGGTRRVEVICTPVSSRETVDAVLVQLIDLGRAEERESTLRDQAALIDAARDAIIVRDLDGTVEMWNLAASELYGAEADEAIGRAFHQVVQASHAELAIAMADTLRDGYWAEELACTTADGRSLIVDCRWQLLPGADGAPDRILSVDTDVTQWRREEDLRIRAKRMESIGTFAGGIAHDLNNVLTPILMSIQLLESTETDPDKRELLATMETATRRGADMIRQVLAFARGREGKRDTVSIAAILEETRRLAAETLPSTIALRVEIDDEAGATVGDETQLIQVLANLVSNARDAMPDGGTLALTASNLILDDEHSALAFGVAPGQYVLVEALDTGHGMSTDVLESIFEPFFTTKSVGKGTGLGLASSLAIVRSHGGSIRVYSEPGHGTRFSVLLPAIESEVDSSAFASREMKHLPRGTGELIVIADDDETIRLITSRTLESYGYRTLTAQNGKIALDLIASTGGGVDLLLTDMMMPDVDGAETAAYLHQHHPRIPVIAASGLVAADGVERGAIAGVAAFVPKPFTTSQLLTTVRDVLDGVERADDHGLED
jgi:two-component system, cell cycle sensor histidine kinase and response regulator CckA